MPGIFFAYDLNRGRIVLADRGRGILATLKKVRPKLSTHQDALKIAFTEIVSGRAPEYRGNGLKFVKDVVVSSEIRLFFQTGDACIKIKKYDLDLKVKKSNIYKFLSFACPVASQRDCFGEFLLIFNPIFFFAVKVIFVFKIIVLR